MGKDQDKYRPLIDSMIDGFAYHQIVKDRFGTPVDYLFLDMNPAFESMTGLVRGDILGKTVTEVLPEIEDFADDWIETYGQVAATGKATRFESYSKPMKRWYEVSANCVEHGCFAAIFRDITENKRETHALAASETRYRSLFESAQDGILIVDAKSGKILNANPYLVELLGYSKEGILGKTIWEIGTFKDILASQDNFQKLQQKGFIRYENLPLLSEGGRTVAVEFVSHVYWEDQQKVIQCNIRDITDRKRSELFQNLSGDVLAILNTPGAFYETIQRILSTMKATTGIEAIGMRLQKDEDFPYYAQKGFPDDFMRSENTLSAHDPGGDTCRNSDESILLECACRLVLSDQTDPLNPLLTPQGSCWTNDGFPCHDLLDSVDPRLHIRNVCSPQEYASVALVPVRQEKKIIGLLHLSDRRKGQFNSDAICALEEIANHIGEALARIQMEAALRESEQKLSSILNNVTDVIWSLSLPDMNMFYVSPSVETLYGRSAEEFSKNPSLWQKTVHPDDQHLAKEAFAQLYQEGTAERESRIVRPDDSFVWIHDRSQLIYNEKHVPVRIEGIASDISGRKLAEESLKKRLAELEAIYTIASALRTAESLDDMLTLMLTETLNILNCQAGAIGLYSPTQGQMSFATTQGWYKELDDTFLKPEAGLTGNVFASGKVRVTREYAKDTRMQYKGKIPAGWGGVCLPLRSETDVVGVLFVSVQLPREISSEEIRLLTSLSEMAGTAIHRIGLYEKNLRHLEKEQALRHIDRAIAGSLDLRVTFRVILDEVCKLLNVDAAAILRFDPYTGMLKYEAWHGFRIANPANLSLRIGEGFAGQAAMGRKSIRVADLSESEEDSVQAPLLETEGAHSYCAVPLLSKGCVEGVLEVFHREPLGASEEWLSFLEALAGQTALAIDSAELIHDMANTNFKLIQSYDNTIKGWAHALDLRDKETEDHSQRVAEMTVNMARKMGMRREDLAHIRRGALLHDIGKMGVSDTILLKPGPLNKDEWAIMQQHPVFAFEMLAPIEYLRTALDIPYCHHEKWDGTGYPRGLKGEQIPLSARIFAVADVYDALTSDRPYRKAWSQEETLKHIRQGSGKHFDPQAVKLLFEEIKK